MTHPLEKELDNIHVFNKTTLNGTVTNIDGRFTISVSMSDTLLISALQYEKISVVISLEHVVTKKIKIELSSITNELDEIFLKRHSLSGDLFKDAAHIKTTAPTTPFSLGIVDKEIRVLTQSQRQLKTAKSGFIDPLINALSGRTKMLKNRVEIDKKNERIEALLATYPVYYLSLELKIDENSVHDFLYFCETHPDFKSIVQKDNMTILNFLREEAFTYQLLKKEEQP